MRTRPAIQTNEQISGDLNSRLYLAYTLGLSYSGDRDLYTVLGYPTDVTFADCYGLYRRHEIARSVIDKPVRRSWKGSITIVETREADTTPLERAWEDLMAREDLRLKSNLVKLDKLTGLGSYGVLLLGFSDVTSREGFQTAPTGRALQLRYVKALSSENAKVRTYDQDTSSPRYGQPLLYDINLQDSMGSNFSLTVHYQRVIHVVEEPLENDLSSDSRLVVIYNRLKDLEKLLGGSGEMFWRGARPGYSGKTDKDFRIDPTTLDTVKEQITEYEHNLRRILLMEGIDLQALQTQVSDPSSHIDKQLEAIAAQTNIPKRILVGSERGELSSEQDATEWASYIQDRREEFIEGSILRPLISRLILFGVLPKPTEKTYMIQWESLFQQSDEQKARVGQVRASALKEYASSPEAGMILPPEAFMEFFLGLDQEQIELITHMREEYLKELPEEEEPEEVVEEDLEETEEEEIIEE